MRLTDKIEVLNVDCMEYLAGLEDNAFELAIVDPPYGIGASKPIEMGKWKRRIHTDKKWDTDIPPEPYFQALKRVSENQIIWGGNYFIDFLRSTRCFIVWDKKNGSNNMADCELAWASFSTSVRKFTRNHIEDYNNGIDKIHPTQKPVALYKWLLTNYAKPGDRILDTHLGSMSIAIACHDLGYELTGCEIDKDYFDAGVKRVKNHIAQGQLFEPEPQQPEQGKIF